MYNTQNKEDFIAQELVNTKDSNVAMLNKFFNSFANNEKELGKDLCDFTTDEIINVYKGKSLSSYATIYTYNRVLIRYTDWCIAAGRAQGKTNHYVEIADKEILMSFLNTTRKEARIITRAELLEDLTSEESEIILPNPVNRFLPLAFFEGVGVKNRCVLDELTMDDIKGNTLTYPDGSRIEISNELKELAQESANTYHIYKYAEGDPPSFLEELSDRRYSDDDPRIVKQRPNTMGFTEARYIKRLDMEVDKVAGVLGKVAYSFNNLRVSGKIHLIREMYAESKCTNYSAFLDRHGGELEAKFGKVSRSFINNYAEYFK